MTTRTMPPRPSRLCPEADAAARKRLAYKHPPCAVCGKAMCLGQVGTHYSCRSTPDG